MIARAKSDSSSNIRPAISCVLSWCHCSSIWIWFISDQYGGKNRNKPWERSWLPLLGIVKLTQKENNPTGSTPLTMPCPYIPVIDFLRKLLVLCLTLLHLFVELPRHRENDALSRDWGDLWIDSVMVSKIPAAGCESAETQAPLREPINGIWMRWWWWAKNSNTTCCGQWIQRGMCRISFGNGSGTQRQPSDSFANSSKNKASRHGWL